MRNREGTLTRKGMAVTGAVFVALTALVFVLLANAVTARDLRETYSLAQETVTFLEGTCEKFDNSQQGYSAKSLQTLLDDVEGFSRFLPSDKVGIDDGMLREFIQTEHIGGMIALDSTGEPIAQADIDEAGSYALWSDVIAKPVVQAIFSHPEVTYSDIIERGDVGYEFVAASYDDGVLIAYASLLKTSVDPYEQTVADLLASNTFHENPLVVMEQNGKAVSANDSDIVGEDFESQLDHGNPVAWDDGALARVAYDGGVWYAQRTSYEDYRFYILYSESEVFADRAGFIAVGLSVYLALCVAILVVRGYADKRALRATQKQLRIINAISATYESTLLLHLDTMQMEAIKIKPEARRAFEDHPDYEGYIDFVCREVVAPESRDAVCDLMDVSTMENRLQGSAFLGVDVKTEHGAWYSLQIIPQRRDERGRLLAVLVATRDVTALKRAEELSFRDKLTGLYNRNYLESRQGELMRVGDKPVTVVMADCNYLKRTNDTLGHEWGDKLLQRVAGVLREKVPADCLVMRLGGDEFLLVCPHTDAARAALIVAGVKDGLEKASDADLTLSVSFGAHTVVEDGDAAFDDAFKAADEAMYAEKRAAHEADREQAAEQ